jgi:hypothetical protein
MFLLLSLAVEGLAQIGRVAVQVQPANPTTQDAITLVLSGDWKDSCVPRVTGVKVAGGLITISTESWAGFASWSSPRGGRPFPWEGFPPGRTLSR